MELWELLLILLVGIQALTVIESRPSVAGRESSSDIAYLEVDQFLTSYGYYPSSDLIPAQERNPSPRKHSERTKALKLFQKFCNLPETGKLDKETTRLMQTPRCGNPDITSNVNTMGTPEDLEMEEEEDVGQTRNETKNQGGEESGVNVDRERRSLDMSSNKRVKRNRAAGGKLTKWENKVMRWFVASHPKKNPSIWPRIFMNTQVENTWPNVVPITFVEATQEMIQQGETDLAIVFHSFANMSWNDKWHQGYAGWRNQGDDPRNREDYFKNLFEQRLLDYWNKVSVNRNITKKAPKITTYRHAHAMVPAAHGESSRHRAIHFDDDYQWDILEFRTAIVHEIGHALGIHHNSHPASIMNPYNRQATEFSTADLRAVKKIYGKQGGRLLYHFCRAKLREVKDVFRAPRHPYAKSIYIISAGPWGDRVQLTSKRENVRTYYPFLEVFPHAPSKYDVVFPGREDNQVIFISGKKIHTVEVPANRSGIVGLAKIPYPETPKFAVQQSFQGRTFTIFFGEKYTWRFDFNGRRVLTTHHYEMSKELAQVLSEAKFAVQWTDGIIYVVAQNRYYTVDVNPLHLGNEKITDDKPGSPDWLKQMLCRCKTETSNLGVYCGTVTDSITNQAIPTKRWGSSSASLMQFMILIMITLY